MPTPMPTPLSTMCPHKLALDHSRRRPLAHRSLSSSSLRQPNALSASVFIKSTDYMPSTFLAFADRPGLPSLRPLTRTFFARIAQAWRPAWPLSPLSSSSRECCCFYFHLQVLAHSYHWAVDPWLAFLRRCSLIHTRMYSLARRRGAHLCFPSSSIDSPPLRTAAVYQLPLFRPLCRPLCRPLLCRFFWKTSSESTRDYAEHHCR